MADIKNPWTAYYQTDLTVNLHCQPTHRPVQHQRPWAEEETMWSQTQLTYERTTTCSGTGVYQNIHASSTNTTSHLSIDSLALTYGRWQTHSSLLESDLESTEDDPHA